jgi:hypothetical protein
MCLCVCVSVCLRSQWSDHRHESECLFARAHADIAAGDPPDVSRLSVSSSVPATGSASSGSVSSASAIYIFGIFMSKGNLHVRTRILVACTLDQFSCSSYVHVHGQSLSKYCVASNSSRRHERLMRTSRTENAQKREQL